MCDRTAHMSTKMTNEHSPKIGKFTLLISYLMNFNNGLSTNWLHYKKKILILWMRKITVLKVLAIEIVYLILLKEETGVDYVVTIDKSSHRRQSLWLKLMIFGFYNM